MHLYKRLFPCILLVFLTLPNLLAQNTRWVEDILFDPIVDDPAFKLCNDESQAIQYFNNGQSMEYNGDKPAIDSIFRVSYTPIPAASETGLVRIRFLVNCKGETGRFRVMGMDENYQAKVFDERITGQLLQISKSLRGWRPKQWKNWEADYYQYLIFKIKAGAVTQILP